MCYPSPIKNHYAEHKPRNARNKMKKKRTNKKQKNQLVNMSKGRQSGINQASTRKYSRSASGQADEVLECFCGRLRAKIGQTLITRTGYNRSTESIREKVEPPLVYHSTIAIGVDGKFAGRADPGRNRAFLNVMPQYLDMIINVRRRKIARSSPLEISRRQGGCLVIPLPNTF